MAPIQTNLHSREICVFLTFVLRVMSQRLAIQLLIGPKGDKIYYVQRSQSCVAAFDTLAKLISLSSNL